MEHIIFLDIETASIEESYSQLNVRMQQLWNKKAEKLKHTDDQTPFQLYKNASIYAEFGKIICISAAYMKNNKLRIKSFYDMEEKTLLQNFADLLQTYFSKKNNQLCAHNGKEFDFPYLCRRMLINNIRIPDILNIAGRKPWETKFLDTMEMWKFGDYKNYTSLDLLSAVFGISSPKEDIDGSMIHEIYWQLKDLQRIKNYCERDVLTVAQLFLRYQGKELLTDEQIVFL
jgi:predicted PolB exonuclease-like 3'-5' exonuclease